MILSHSLPRVLGVLILSACSIPFSAVAQDFQGGSQTSDPLFRSLDLNPLQSLGRASSPALTETMPLEGPVDPETYLVGPGDIFTISIGGGTPVVATSRVSADGLLPILEYGAVDAAGLSLLEVKKAADERLKEHFENVNINVT
ncbi:MAG: polysaccharide biosynthesis/export family protein, partial [Rhodothermales bacterium]|nr:polysaccharide biosynthesis/export family protein [Rhodothermales bacterium]